MLLWGVGSSHYQNLDSEQMATNNDGGKVLAENVEGLVSATSLTRRRDGVDGNDIVHAPPQRPRCLRRLPVEHVDGQSGSEYW